MENNEREIRDLILPTDLCTRVSEWHGGMWSACYSLCSTGMGDYVSLAMIEAAADELDLAATVNNNDPISRADCRDLEGELRAMLIFPEEFRA